MKTWFLVFAKFYLAALTLTALVVQFFSDTKQIDFNPINFFSFFTHQASFIAAIALIVSAVFILQNKSSRRLDLLRGVALIYMVITGIVYQVLLSDLPDLTGTAVPWVNPALHIILPIGLVIDSLLDPPAQRYKYKDILWWLVFPIVFVLYSLIRGSLTGWYPYPFLDPANSGLVSTFGYIVVMGSTVAVLSAIVIWVSRLRVK